MQDFFETAELGLNHVQVMVRGMYAVATSEDVHPAEQVMMREFYETCRVEADGIADYNDLVKQPLEPAEAADVLGTKELRAIFLKSCLFLAFADGQYSEAERATIERFADGLEFDKEALADVEAEVTDYLIQQIARIRNIDALQEVAGELWKR